MHKPTRKTQTLVARLKITGRAARDAVRALRKRLPSPVKRALRRVTHWTLHSTLGVVIAVALVFLAAHLWLPTLAERKAEIELHISSALGNPVTLGALDTYWDGLNPGVRVQEIRVHSTATGEQAIRLKELRLSLGWWPLLTGRIEVNSLVLVEPHLTVERQADDGRLRISGIEASASAKTDNTDYTKLLLAQKEVVIENGELLWRDRRAGVEQEDFRVRKVNLELRNDADRHRLEFRADFPDTLCADCRLSADIHGYPFRETSWRGEISLRARALSVHGLPGFLRASLPPSLVGRFDLDITSHWRDAKPEFAKGLVAVSNLSLTLPGETQPLKVKALDTEFNWEGSNEVWRLDLANLRLGLTRPAWRAGQLRLDVQPERLRLEVEHVDVADLAAFTAALPREHVLLNWLRVAQPAGGMNRLRVDLTGPATKPSDYRAEGELRNVRFVAHERVPGVLGLSGQLSLSRESGEFRLDSGDMRVSLPRIFSKPLTLQRLTSRIRWRQNPEDWFVQAQDIVLNAQDGRVRGNFELRLPHDNGISPVINLRANFSDGDGRHTARYIPLTLPEGLRTWIERAVITGRVTGGHVLLHGALRNFPFRDGKGKFEVRAHVKDGVLDYLQGWAPIREMDADLFFTGTNMLITSTHSTIRSLKVGRMVVAIEDFRAPDGAVVTVKGRIAGGLQETLDVLGDSKTPHFVSLVPTGTHAAGDGVLALDLRIPVRAPKTMAIAGFYRFRNNSVVFPLHSISVENIQGGMEFNKSGLRTGTLNAKLLGGDAVLTAIPDATQLGVVRVEASGTLTEAGLAKVFGPELSPLVSGQAPWQARLLPHADGSSLFVEADLRDLELRLPAPLAKAQGDPLLFQVRTRSAGNDSEVLDLQMAERVTGKLAFQREASGWKFTHGRVGIGEKVMQLPLQSGLQLSARLSALNVDDWWPLLRRKLSGSSGSSWLDRVSHVNAEIEALEAFGRGFGRLSLDMSNSAGSWQGHLRGDAIVGQLAISPPVSSGLPLVVGNVAAPGRSAIHLILENLILPQARTAGADLSLDPRGLPALHVQSQAFTFDDKDLGALEFSALPATHGWKIASLKLTRPESGLTASGLWEIDSRSQQTTQFDATLTSTDAGKLLETLGYTDEVIGGNLTLQSNWSWSGALTAFRLAQTDGDINFSLSNGRIPKISPGAGRLLGALDLGSVSRYLTLDFSNVFSKGLTFDSIEGKVAVEKGNAYTRDLAIHTPGADIRLSGRIGLVARDLDLELGVTPHLMEELAITGGLLGGPVVGAAVAVIHQLVKKPFQKSTRIKYTVAGGWDSPAVTRLGPPPSTSTDVEQ